MLLHSGHAPCLSELGCFAWPVLPPSCSFVDVSKTEGFPPLPIVETPEASDDELLLRRHAPLTGPLVSHSLLELEDFH